MDARPFAGNLASRSRSQYDNAMSSPLALQANVPGGVSQVAGDVTPTRLAAPHASAAHSFFNVLRDLIHKTGGFHNEADLLDALGVIDAYERKVVSDGDLKQVSTDNDRAAVEDVTKRPVPAGGVPAPLQTPQPIDYQQLAAALAPMLAAQVQQSQQSQQAPPPVQAQQ